MQINIEELGQKSYEEICRIFSSIPKSTVGIELVGEFHNVLQITAQRITKALLYLPRHIYHVDFRVHYRYEEFSYSWSRDSGVGDPTTYTDKSHKKSIGNSLKKYISSLPSSISSIAFTFIGKEKYFGRCSILEDMLEVVKCIPPHVNYLHLSNESFSYRDDRYFETHSGESFVNWAAETLTDAISNSSNGYSWFNAERKIFTNIPSTVTTLVTSQFNFGSGLLVGELPYWKPVLAGVSHSVEELYLTNTKFYKLNAQYFPDFFESLPPNLITLDLSYNDLHRMNSLRDFVLSLSSLTRLKVLGLRGNQLSTLPPEQLVQMFSVLPSTLEELDIGLNGLFFLDISSFETIMRGLPNTLKSLMLNENQITVEQLRDRLPYVPHFIKTISFKQSGLSFPVDNFLRVISSLPETVICLDLEACRLSKRSVDDLVTLFSHLPAHFRSLKLRFNFLAGFELDELQRILSSLPPWIKELDVSDNGFDRLPYSQMQAVWLLFPPTIQRLITGRELQIRNDGVLVPYRGLVQRGLFQLPRPLRYQAEFAKYFVTITRLAVEHLNFDVAFHILSYVLGASKAEINHLRRSLSAYPISSLPPAVITTDHEEECLAMVAQRIKHLQPTDTRLDLSHCGLNRLGSRDYQENFIVQLKALSSTVTVLKLRGNGFLLNPKCREIFADLVLRIPREIICLDLSANDFEYQSAEELAQLFLSLPPTVQLITLDHEEPIAPLLQIAKRHWPQAYLRLTQNCPDKLQQVRALFNNYTIDDSAFWRFVRGHWNRHHTGEVARLVYYIDQGLIRTAEDLVHEAEQINLTNAGGSLAKRLSFLAYHEPKPERNYLPDGEHEEEYEVIEMQPLV